MKRRARIVGWAAILSAFAQMSSITMPVDASACGVVSTVLQGNCDALQGDDTARDSTGTVWEGTWYEYAEGDDESLVFISDEYGHLVQAKHSTINLEAGVFSTTYNHYCSDNDVLSHDYVDESEEGTHYASDENWHEPVQINDSWAEYTRSECGV